MAKYQMRCERYMQFSKVVEVEADTLQEAMEKDYFGDEQEWMEEEWATDERLYSVSNGVGETLMCVAFPKRAGNLTCWTGVCLDHQWNGVGKLKPVITAEGRAELVRHTAKARSKSKSSRK